MSDASKHGQKRKKSYYVQSSNKTQKGNSRLRALEPGMRGFLITCNNREREAVREAYNLLNEYADQLCGPEKQNTGEDGDGVASGGEEEEDMEAALAKEVTSLKKDMRSEERRFQVVRSGSNNCVFIKTTVERPDELVHHIFTDVQKTQTSKSRFILRLQPVIASCKADEEKIVKLAEDVLPAFLGEEQGGHTFSINLKVRNNNGVHRDKMLPLLAGAISDMCAGNKVNLDTPELVVSVDVIRTVCCISVLKDFTRFRKYNLQEIVLVKDKEGANESKDDIKTGQEDVGEVQGNDNVIDGEGRERDNEGESKDDIKTGQEDAAEVQGNDNVIDGEEGEKDDASGTEVVPETITSGEVPQVVESSDNTDAIAN